jgi:hypothetical protein
MISKIFLNVFACECFDLSLLGSFNDLLNEGCTTIKCACHIIGVFDDKARVTSDIVDLYIVCVNCLRALTDPSLDHGQAVQSSARAASQGGERIRMLSVISVANLSCLGQ